MANTKFNRNRAKSYALWAMGIGALLMMVLVVSFNAKVEKKEKKVKHKHLYICCQLFLGFQDLLHSLVFLCLSV